MTTGQKIYEARKKAGMTQEALADRLGVSRQSVSRWESDSAYPETDKLIELCKLFSLSADELLLGADKQENSQEEATKQSSTKQQTNFNLYDENGKIHFEYVSRKRVGKLPLVHINIGLGIYRAKGVIAIGNIATGILSLGFLSIGVLSFGLLALGLMAFGAFSIGLLVGAGSIAAGFFAFGGVAVGVMSFGGVAIGYISVGGCAIGQYAAGGYAQGFVAIGSTGASGTHAFTVPEQFDQAYEFIDANIVGWLGDFLKDLASTLKISRS